MPPTMPPTKGGEDNKDGARGYMPSQVEGCMAATMDNRLTTEEDEAITTLPGLCHDRPPTAQQSAIGKGGGGGYKEDDKEEHSDGFWRMTGKAAAALTKRRRLQ
jgi:hypothetical protein